MGKKKRSILKPLIMLAVSVVMIVCFFLPWMSQTVSGGIGSISGSSTTTVGGIESLQSLFGGKVDAEKSAAYNLAVGLQANEKTSGAMTVNSVAMLIMLIVAALAAVAALLSILRGKKMLFGKLFAFVLFGLSIVVLICSIVVVSNASAAFGADIGIVANKYAIHIASILAAVMGLGGMAASFLIKK